MIAVEAIGPYNRTDVWAAHELYHANGWTDGLPIVPSTCEVVSACFEMAVADPVQLVGVDRRRMAGCLPTHFTVVLACFGNAAAGVLVARGDGLKRRLRGSGCTDRAGVSSMRLRRVKCAAAAQSP